MSDAIDFRLPAGDSKTIELTTRDDAGAIVDVSGAAITWALIKHPGGTPLLTKSTEGVGPAITVGAPNSGLFYVPLDPEDTADLPPRAYFYEAEVIEADGTNSTVLTGRVILEASSIVPVIPE